MPIDTSGYSAYRAADLLTLGKAKFEAELIAAGDSEPVEWDRDYVLGAMMTATVALQSDVCEETQLLYDMWNLNNAQGTFLDSLGQLLGFARKGASQSTATIEFTSTATTTIPSGSRVYDLDESTVFWQTTSELTFSGAETKTTTILCETYGAITPPSLSFGLNTSVSNVSRTIDVSNVAVGLDEETDPLFRTRMGDLAARGANSAAALETELQGLSFVSGATVLENDWAVVQIVEGIAMAPQSIAVYVLPDPMTADQINEVHEVIARHCTAGVYSAGSGARGTVTYASGASKNVGFSYGIELPVDVAVAVTPASGYTTPELETGVEDAIEAYFADLRIGEAVNILQLYGILADITGLKSAVITLNGGGSDIEPTRVEQAIIDTITVT